MKKTSRSLTTCPVWVWLTLEPCDLPIPVTAGSDVAKSTP
jgi:hypothetical protein